MGAKAVAKNRKVADKKQATMQQVVTIKSVRDSSGMNWHGSWVGHPHWGCVDEFATTITEMFKKHAAAAHKAGRMAEMCQCKHKYLGVCSYDHFICIADIELKLNKR